MYLKYNVICCQEAKEKFQQLQKVISILGDAEKRALYDQTGITDDDVRTSFVALQFYLWDSSNIFLILPFHLRHWWEKLQTIFRSTSEQCTRRRYGCFYVSCRLMLPINLQLYFLGNKVGKTLLSLVYPVLSYETWLLKKRRTLNNCKKNASA